MTVSVQSIMLFVLIVIDLAAETFGWRTRGNHVTKPRTKNTCVRDFVTLGIEMSQTQIEKLRDFMSVSTIARSRDLTKIGVSATTISRAVADGELMRIGRGVYQLSDAAIFYTDLMNEVYNQVKKDVESGRIKLKET